MKTIDGFTIRKKMQELLILLGDNPIASDFEEVYEYTIDNVFYPSVLLDIIEEGAALAAKEEDMSILYRGLRKVLDGIHSILAVS
nr:hypothetical protein [Bacteroides intestinalis]